MCLSGRQGAGFAVSIGHAAVVGNRAEERERRKESVRIEPR
jgi:hypothetical protein